MRQIKNIYVYLLLLYWEDRLMTTTEIDVRYMAYRIELYSRWLAIHNNKAPNLTKGAY
jgi:hypothetical protein